MREGRQEEGKKVEKEENEKEVKGEEKEDDTVIQDVSCGASVIASVRSTTCSPFPSLSPFFPWALKEVNSEDEKLLRLT
ncbi:hypothetical protein E2C01_079108 [Portunus trituberculatus]|uniref:Uncharacterized protein n=1 Tax=Portunus trituberculatus TaxID=210409 RepID=A0A5B7IIS8_PORTR|nr:hypothetical protein [Portunus trituberculatus]